MLGSKSAKSKFGDEDMEWRLCGTNQSRCNLRRRIDGNLHKNELQLVESDNGLSLPLKQHGRLVALVTKLHFSLFFSRFSCASSRLCVLAFVPPH